MLQNHVSILAKSLIISLQYNIESVYFFCSNPVDQKYLTSFETSCWRRIENIGWNSCVKTEEELHRVRKKGGWGEPRKFAGSIPDGVSGIFL